MREQYIIKEIKEEIQRRIKEEEKLESFNLLEMDHNTPEFKNYYHKEYLISYYKRQELNNLLEYIDEVSK